MHIYENVPHGSYLLYLYVHVYMSFEICGSDCLLGFGVYGSYSEEHIKTAQKQAFQQFLVFMGKH